jgi:GT2 family glycosyltransferase
MSEPEIALLVSSFERPAHLRRCLISIAAQVDVSDRLEVVVTDDGSKDSTAEMVSAFAATAPFPVTFVTHEHNGFKLTKCRNDGVRASRAPYLLFLDGDCILPPDGVRKHLLARKPRTAYSGDYYRLDRSATESLDESAVCSGAVDALVSPRERSRIRFLWLKSSFYQSIGHWRKPKPLGGCFAMWREDYVRVNGYDENFRSWGCEDDDLNLRLRRCGVRVRTILGITRQYHLWHPRDPSAPRQWRDGDNVRYLRRPARLTRCRNGLTKRDAAALVLRLAGTAADGAAAQRLLTPYTRGDDASPVEVEVAFAPGTGDFSGRAEYQVLVVLADDARARRLSKRAHIVVGDALSAGLAAKPAFALVDFAKAIESVV